MVDVPAVLTRLLPALNADGWADLTFWSEAELTGHADEALQGLAARVGLFALRHEGTLLVEGTGSYAVPARHVRTMHVSAGSLALTAASVPEVEALDNDWEAATGTPRRFLLEPPGTVRVHPAPDATAAGQALAMVSYGVPAAGGGVVAMPAAVEELVTFAVLSAARGREGKAAMPEVAAWCGEMAGLLEQACRTYWGEL